MKTKEHNGFSFLTKGAAVLALSCLLVACDNPNNRETAAEKEVEEESADVREGINEAANDIERSAEKAGEKITGL